MTFLTSIVEFVQIETLKTDSFADGSDAQRHLCEIQNQLDADGSLAGVIIDDDWIANWNKSDISERAEMLLNYVKIEMHMAVSSKLEL